MPPFYMLLCFLLFSAVLVGMGFPGSSLIVMFIGVTYPTWCSILALETEETMEDDKKWLTYWMIFSMFNLLDNMFAWVT